MKNQRNNELVNSSFLLVIENKKGKLIGLSATLNKEGIVDLYGISKRGFKIIKTIKKEALIDNDKVKAVYGNTMVAEEMRNLIKTEGLTVERAKNIQNLSLLTDFENIIKEIF